MFIKLLILLFLVPTLEIYTLLRFGELLGVGTTVALVITTGICGAWLAKTQGIEVIRKIQEALARGEMPQEELLDGLVIFTGGLVLLTPGFWTDLFGFFCLVPATRSLIKNWLKPRLNQIFVISHH